MNQDLLKHLEHYGTKGMKWGVRKDRGGSSGSKTSSRPASKMSDSELKKRVNRLNLEKQYSDLRRQESARNQTSIQKGADIVGSILLSSGKQVATTLVTRKLLSFADRD